MKAIKVTDEAYQLLSTEHKKTKVPIIHIASDIILGTKPSKPKAKKKEEPTPQEFRDVWWEHRKSREVEENGMRNRQLKDLYQKTLKIAPQENPADFFEMILSNLALAWEGYLTADVTTINKNYVTIINQIRAKQRPGKESIESEYDRLFGP